MSKLSCDNCICLHCDNGECTTSMCEGCPYPEEDITKCHMTECDKYFNGEFEDHLMQHDN